MELVDVPDTSVQAWLDIIARVHVVACLACAQERLDSFKSRLVEAERQRQVFLTS